MIKLTKPILIEIDEGYSVPVKDFRQYARCMMYPDPTGIDMSEELDDLVTNAINEGKTTLHAAFDKLVKRDTNGRIDYSYSDGFDGFVYGQELLCFCDADNPALKCDSLESKATELMDSSSRAQIVTALEEFRDLWKCYDKDAAEKAQALLDCIASLFNKDGESQ